MASLEQFIVNINKRAKDVKEGTNKLMRRIALAVDQTVVLETPVDTGRARSNWVVSTGSAFNAEIEPYAPLPQRTDASKKGERANAAGAIEQGQRALGAHDNGQTIFISNNLDYIGDLNRGHSAQAPPEFVQKATQAALAEIRKTRLTEG